VIMDNIGPDLTLDEKMKQRKRKVEMEIIGTYPSTMDDPGQGNETPMDKRRIVEIDLKLRYKETTIYLKYAVPSHFKLYLRNIDQLIGRTIFLTLDYIPPSDYIDYYYKIEYHNKCAIQDKEKSVIEGKVIDVFPLNNGHKWKSLLDCTIPISTIFLTPVRINEYYHFSGGFLLGKFDNFNL
jgi:hypothetical protein